MGKMAWIDGALHLLIDGRWMHHETVENAIADESETRLHPEVEEALPKVQYSDGWFAYQKLRKAGWQLCPSVGLSPARIHSRSSILRAISGVLKKMFER